MMPVRLLRSRLHFTAALAIGAIVSAAQSPTRAPGHVSDRDLLDQARALRLQHHTQQAEAALSPLLEREPDNPDALVLLARMRLDKDDQAEAIKLLIRALAASPNSIEANDVMGGLLLRGHSEPEAMDRFETVLKVAPADRDARSGELVAATELAVAARKSDHPEVALQVLEHARTALPDDPKLLLNLGIQATELHRLSEAADALAVARRLSPHDPETLFALAELETEQQHMAQAEADFRGYLAANPNDATAHFGLGHIFAMQRRVDEARAEFNRAIEIQPVQTESYYQLGQLDLDAQQDADAESFFRKVLARDPRHGGALAGLGVIAFRVKDYSRAEQYLAEAERASPDYVLAHYYRGLALARMGRKDEAEAELTKATELGHEAANPVH